MSDTELIPAATVILARDSDAGPEVLMLKRNSKIAFGGMWVFPGGRLDPEDHVSDDLIVSSRNAAVREANEEAGLVLDAADLVAWSYWVPPALASIKTAGPRRRFSTWFFLAEAPGGEVTIDDGEIHEHRWLTPAAAMTKRNAGEIELAPPTWVTLHQLGQHKTVADATTYGASQLSAPYFETRPLATTPLSLAWDGDHAYHGGDPHDEGPRNRLVLDDSGWEYDFRPFN